MLIYIEKNVCSICEKSLGSEKESNKHNINVHLKTSSLLLSPHAAPVVAIWSMVSNIPVMYAVYNLKDFKSTCENT